MLFLTRYINDPASVDDWNFFIWCLPGSKMSRISEPSTISSTPTTVRLCPTQQAKTQHAAATLQTTNSLCRYTKARCINISKRGIKFVCVRNMSLFLVFSCLTGLRPIWAFCTFIHSSTQRFDAAVWWQEGHLACKNCSWNSVGFSDEPLA